MDLLNSVQEDEQEEPEREPQPETGQGENGPPEWVTPEMEAEIAEAASQAASSDDEAGERVRDAEMPPDIGSPICRHGLDPPPQASTSEEEAEEEPEEPEEPQEPSRGPLPTFEVEGPASFWKQLSKALRAVNGQFPVHFEGGKLRLVAVDSAHVSMVDARVTPMYCDLNGYRDEDPPYGIDVEKLWDFAKALKAKNRCSLLYLEETPDEGGFLLRSGYLERRTKPLDGEGFTMPQIPNLEWENATIVIQAQKLRDILKLMGSVTDTVTLTMEPDRGFTVRAIVDDDQPEVKAFVEKFDLLELKGGAAKAHFPLKELETFLKAFSKEDLEICLPGDDYPLRLRVSFGDCYLTYLLAPRILDA